MLFVQIDRNKFLSEFLKHNERAMMCVVLTVETLLITNDDQIILNATDNKKQTFEILKKIKTIVVYNIKNHHRKLFFLKLVDNVNFYIVEIDIINHKAIDQTLLRSIIDENYDFFYEYFDFDQ